ncbi:protein of unknown function [Nocardioides terrae]|uniref:GXWXG protein n=1 Tax=Nocardioides terrae TaxID=574651 RepID=A0A1I1L663_9ACTN|nr:DUF4334 domain-containing protein [Nocardioides terrae]SFC65903.1 protein of unknown function [Nocardioides terrae]
MTPGPLAGLEPACSLEDALALFDALPPVAIEELSGRWKGRELRTGHRLDGLLEASGWYGKQFDGVDAVHPLLVTGAGGDVFPVDPRKVPIGLASVVPTSVVARGRAALPVLRPALRTRKHRARLRRVEHRGVVTAALVYDHLPVVDLFRRASHDTVLGLMDRRGDPRPYFFVLQRD